MTGKPVLARPLARRDISDAINHYASEAGPEVASAFIDAFEAAYAAISRRPATGSPRHGSALDLRGLRSRPLKRFPYLVFYVEQPGHIDVWRVLHFTRDATGLLRDL